LLLWVGAIALGALVVVRDRWRKAAAAGRAVPGPALRQGVEALCIFLGTAGTLFGLGLMGLEALY